MDDQQAAANAIRPIASPECTMATGAAETAMRSAALTTAISTRPAAADISHSTPRNRADALAACAANANAEARATSAHWLGPQDR